MKYKLGNADKERILSLLSAESASREERKLAMPKVILKHAVAQRLKGFWHHFSGKRVKDFTPSYQRAAQVAEDQGKSIDRMSKLRDQAYDRQAKLIKQREQYKQQLSEQGGGYFSDPAKSLRTVNKAIKRERSRARKLSPKMRKAEAIRETAQGDIDIYNKLVSKRRLARAGAGAAAVGVAAPVIASGALKANEPSFTPQPPAFREPV